MNALKLNLDALQKALLPFTKDGSAIMLERLGDERLQFRWQDFCEQYDYQELQDVLMRNGEMIATKSQRHEVLAKHVATRFLMQRVELTEAVPCEDA